MNPQPATESTPQATSPVPPPAHLRRLVLTGFMGAGKTTVGRLLAARLGWEFLDLDAYIESRTRLAIPSIFATHGEPHFRQLESRPSPPRSAAAISYSPWEEAPPRSSPTACCWSRPQPRPPSSSTHPSPPSWTAV